MCGTIVRDYGNHGNFSIDCYCIIFSFVRLQWFLGQALYIEFESSLGVLLQTMPLMSAIHCLWLAVVRACQPRLCLCWSRLAGECWCPPCQNSTWLAALTNQPHAPRVCVCDLGQLSNCCLLLCVKNFDISVKGLVWFCGLLDNLSAGMPFRQGAGAEWGWAENTWMAPCADLCAVELFHSCEELSYAQENLSQVRSMFELRTVFNPGQKHQFDQCNDYLCTEHSWSVPHPQRHCHCHCHFDIAIVFDIDIAIFYVSPSALVSFAELVSQQSPSHNMASGVHPCVCPSVC